MKKMEFKLIDAFTTEALCGNPCAVMIGAQGLSDQQMLAIAREMNQSETTFLMPSQEQHLKARYFTPEREILLAGHPTIASTHAAIECGMIKGIGWDVGSSLWEMNLLKSRRSRKLISFVSFWDEICSIKSTG